jgi:hypothetical protein
MGFYKHKKKPDLTRREPQPGTMNAAPRISMDRKTEPDRHAFSVVGTKGRVPMKTVKGIDDDPILRACKNDNPLKALPELMKDIGANPNVCTEDRVTALMLLAQRWDLDAIEYMIGKGAAPFFLDKDLRGMIEYAESDTARKMYRDRQPRAKSFFGIGGVEIYANDHYDHDLAMFKVNLRSLFTKYNLKPNVR